MYADVYLPISIEKSFSYIVPDDLEKNIKVGQIVYVPFGNRLELAYINKINNLSSNIRAVSQNDSFCVFIYHLI